MVKIFVAPDSFKESLSANEFCEVARRAILQIDPRVKVDTCPMADGGEGSLLSVVTAWQGTVKSYPVLGPLGTTVQGQVGYSRDQKSAFVEMANASGLALVPPDKRNPLLATSFGTGELIRHALDAGVQNVVIGLGGTATNDGGAGILQALGYLLLDTDGMPLPLGAQSLRRLCSINDESRHPRLSEVMLTVACDVVNPLLGPTGATMMYGPQKGADPAMVRELEACLTHFAAVVESRLGREFHRAAGAGAAGGAGFSLLSLLAAKRQSGFDFVAAITGLEVRIRQNRYDWILTGEGRVDTQSKHGKLVSRIGRLGLQSGTPVIAFTGQISGDESALGLDGITAIIPIVAGPCTLEEAIREAAPNLLAAIKRVMGLLLRVPIPPVPSSYKDFL